MIKRLNIFILFTLFLSFNTTSWGQDFFGYHLEDSLETKTISLRREKLKELPRELESFKNIETLDLRNNKIDSLPAYFSKFKNLKKLLLSRNKFEKFPEILKSLPNLEHIDLWDNSITNLNFGPEIFPNLKYLDISGILLQPEIYDQLNEDFKSIEFNSSKPCDCMRK